MFCSIEASLIKMHSHSALWNTSLSKTGKRLIGQMCPCQRTETEFFSATELTMSQDKTAVQRQIYSKPNPSIPDVVVSLSLLDLTSTTSFGVAASAGGGQEDTAPLVPASASSVEFPPHKAGVSCGTFCTMDVEGAGTLRSPTVGPFTMDRRASLTPRHLSTGVVHPRRSWLR